MNGMTCSDLCFLVCCPPWPSRIAAKLAFLPPDPTYSLIASEESDSKCDSKYVLHLTDRAEWQFGDTEHSMIDVWMANTSKGNRIACMYVKCNPRSRYTILFSHGNAVDLGLMSSFLVGLGMKLGINIMSYDYSGYGMSSGKPLEKNLYADVECALHQLRTRYNTRLDEVILYGQSIGTAPTVDCASRHEVGGVILHSPLMSGMRVACPGTRRTYCFDAFPNIDKVSSIQSPTLVIHGVDDEVIDVMHGHEIYESLPRPVDPLWVMGAGHNDVEIYPQYLERLKIFFLDDMPRFHGSHSSSGASGDVDGYNCISGGATTITSGTGNSTNTSNETKPSASNATTKADSETNKASPSTSTTRSDG